MSFVAGPRGRLPAPNATFIGCSKLLELPGFEATLAERGLRGMSVAEQVDGLLPRPGGRRASRARRFNMSIGTRCIRGTARTAMSGAPTRALQPSCIRAGRPRRKRGIPARSGIHHLRRSGDATPLRTRKAGRAGGPVEFPILSDLRDAGMTPGLRVARMVSFSRFAERRCVERRAHVRPFPAAPTRCRASSSRAPPMRRKGFTDDAQLHRVGELLPYLALAVKSRSTFDVSAHAARDVSRRGCRGERVLTGEIDRAFGCKTIRAVIWFCGLARLLADGKPCVAKAISSSLLDTYLRADGAAGPRQPRPDPEVHG